MHSVIVLGVCSLGLMAELPAGWHLAGSAPRDYDSSVDSLTPYNGEQTLSLKSRADGAMQGFGTLMRSYDAAPYAGKRVRFSANVKAEGVQEWAGLWMRVDDATHKMNNVPAVVAFDNMQSRPLKGSFGWKVVSVVLDVPEQATGISLGILMEKAGAVWLNGMKLEVVGSDVPTTGMSRKAPANSPSNLTFEK
jgi:hypothetical protein